MLCWRWATTTLSAYSSCATPGATGGAMAATAMRPTIMWLLRTSTSRCGRAASLCLLCFVLRAWHAPSHAVFDPSRTRTNPPRYVGMYAIRGLDDYNFTPEEAENKALFDEAEVNSYQACDIALEEKTTQVSEDTAGKSMGDMFEPNAEALRVFAEIDTDGSGFLSRKELKRAYRLQGPLIVLLRPLIALLAC